MFRLNLPPYPYKTIQKDGKTLIFDDLRRKYVALTPEEWVRQHFVHYLINHKGFPRGLMGNEVSLQLNDTSRRCDTVVYDRQLKPRVIVEYKATTVPITQEVFNQIYRYNIPLHADYLIVSNGLQHFCCHVDYRQGKSEFLTDIPCYSELQQPSPTGHAQ